MHWNDIGYMAYILNKTAAIKLYSGVYSGVYSRVYSGVYSGVIYSGSWSWLRYNFNKKYTQCPEFPVGGRQLLTWQHLPTLWNKRTGGQKLCNPKVKIWAMYQIYQIYQISKCTVNQRLLVSASTEFLCDVFFFMFAYTHLHVTSWQHDVMSKLIAIQCD